MKKSSINFYVLVLGTIFHLIVLASVSDVDGSGDRAIREIWTVKNMLTVTGYYLGFAVLVIAHGLSRLELHADADADWESEEN